MYCRVKHLTEAVERGIEESSMRHAALSCVSTMLTAELHDHLESGLESVSQRCWDQYSLSQDLDAVVSDLRYALVLLKETRKTLRENMRILLAWEGYP